MYLVNKSAVFIVRISQDIKNRTRARMFDPKLAKFKSRLSVLSEFAQRYRVSLFLSFSVMFIAGVILSLSEHGADVADVRVEFLTMAALLVPVSIALNACELQLCAVVWREKIGFENALVYSSGATLMNALPVPGSFMVRAQALLKHGIKLKQVTSIMVVAALMWLMLAGALSSHVLLDGVSAHLLTIAFCGLVVYLIAWIARRSCLVVGIAFFACRLCMLAVVSLRLYFCFSAINHYVPLTDAVVYTVAGIVGSAIPIVPAGLGVSEGIGALLAIKLGSAPAAAFLVLAVNRMIGYFGCVLVFGYFGIHSAKNSR